MKKKQPKGVKLSDGSIVKAPKKPKVFNATTLKKEEWLDLPKTIDVPEKDSLSAAMADLRKMFDQSGPVIRWEAEPGKEPLRVTVTCEYKFKPKRKPRRLSQYAKSRKG